jgi:hypothetical protein
MLHYFTTIINSISGVEKILAIAIAESLGKIADIDEESLKYQKADRKITKRNVTRK